MGDVDWRTGVLGQRCLRNYKGLDIRAFGTRHEEDCVFENGIGRAETHFVETGGLRGSQLVASSSGFKS